MASLPRRACSPDEADDLDVVFDKLRLWPGAESSLVSCTGLVLEKLARPADWGEADWLAESDRLRNVPFASWASLPASESDFFARVSSTGTSRSSAPPTSSQLNKV